MFSVVLGYTNGWTNNLDASDLGRYEVGVTYL